MSTKQFKKYALETGRLAVITASFSIFYAQPIADSTVRAFLID